MNIFSKNLESHILVESTKFENATFPYKTTLSQAIVKTALSPSKKLLYLLQWKLFQNDE